jgi:hypothetical protein
VREGVYAEGSAGVGLVECFDFGGNGRETHCSTSSAVESRIDFMRTMPALLMRIVGGPSCACQYERL